jgi:hypothetical protein
VAPIFSSFRSYCNFQYRRRKTKQTQENWVFFFFQMNLSYVPWLKRRKNQRVKAHFFLLSARVLVQGLVVVEEEGLFFSRFFFF